MALEAVALKLSPQFAYSMELVRQPVITWVSIQVLTGASYVYGCLQLRRLSSGWLALGIIVSTGLLMRGLMCFSTPVLETDFYRYLWDGAMLANGHDPYALAPEVILAGGEQVPDAVSRLAAASQPVLERVNHPGVTTIYPPVSVAVFALAHLVDPWSIDALRLVYFVFDLAAAWLLAWLLLRRRQSPLWLFVYWCNPLLVRCVYNALHMDLVVIGFVSLLMVGIAGRRPLVCAAALGAAIAAKLWPALIAAHLWARERMSGAAVAGLVLGLVLLSPMLPALWHPGSGLLAYAGTWEVNDPVFRLIALAAGSINDHVASTSLLARIISALLFGACLVYLYGTKHAYKDGIEVMIMALGAFLVLQPAPYPWYFLWLSPLLVMRPVSAWIVLTATLPLYDLRFFFEPRAMAVWFDYVVVPLEFSPLLLLARRRRHVS